MRYAPRRAYSCRRRNSLRGIFGRLAPKFLELRELWIRAVTVAGEPNAAPRIEKFPHTLRPVPLYEMELAGANNTDMRVAIPSPLRGSVTTLPQAGRSQSKPVPP